MLLEHKAWAGIGAVATVIVLVVALYTAIQGDQETSRIDGDCVAQGTGNTVICEGQEQAHSWDPGSVRTEANGRFGFSVDVPGEWSRGADSANGDGFVYYDPANPSVTLVGSGSFLLDTGAIDALSESASAAKQYLQDELHATNIRDVESGTYERRTDGSIENVDGRRLSYDFEQNGIDFSGVVQISVGDDRQASVQVTAPTQLFDSFGNDLLLILNSFHLIHCSDCPDA